MRHPQLLLRESAGQFAGLLAELAREARWVVRTPPKRDPARVCARELRPTLFVVEVDPGASDTAAMALIADVHLLAPDVAVVAVSETKLPDPDRAAWTAVLLDLGARAVLFPPVTRPVLEDVVSGLMAAAIRRVTGEAGPAPKPAAEAVIDLADEETHG